jgi:hypothetical protein
MLKLNAIIINQKELGHDFFTPDRISQDAHGLASYLSGQIFFDGWLK